MAALMIRMSRSWTRTRTRVRAWVRPDADVVQAPGVAQGQFSELVDAVGADAVVCVGSVAGLGFGPGCVGGGGGGLMGHSAVGSVVVVFVDEGVELGL